MSAAAPPPHDPAADPDSLCRDLAAMGMSICRALHDRIVQSDDAPPPAPDGALPGLAHAFSAVATAVRRTILLAERLKREPTPPRPTNAQHRTRILREVEDQITAARLDPEQADGLTAELYERIDAVELAEDLGTRPTEDIIRDIVRDLGLGPFTTAPRKRRTPADVAALAARARRSPELTALIARLTPGKPAQHEAAPTPERRLVTIPDDS